MSETNKANPAALLAASMETEGASGVFVATIAALKNGQFVTKIDDLLRELTEAVNKTQAKGSITIKLNIAPNGIGAGDAPLFKVTPKVTRSMPEMPEKGQTFFADENHNLTRRNPGQEDFKLSLVQNPAAGSGAKAVLPAVING